MTQVAQLLTEAKIQLQRRGDDAAAVVAEVLLMHVLQKNRSWLYAWPEKTLPGEPVQQFRQLLEARCNGSPVAYLTGSREFWSLDFQVNEGTLIPRPETELLVETVLTLADVPDQLSLLDLGTGSGAIAIAVASERANWQITATDQSEAALQVAKGNALRHNIRNIEFLQSHWLQELRKNQHFHIIVSNPPYIAETDPHLQQGDLRYEPASALIGGKDGFRDLQEIIATAPAWLQQRGWLLVEHGHEQGAPVRSLFQQHNFNRISTLNDLQQIPRLTMGQL